jgi:hypothetical protein
VNLFVYSFYGKLAGAIVARHHRLPKACLVATQEPVGVQTDGFTLLEAPDKCSIGIGGNFGIFGMANPVLFPFPHDWRDLQPEALRRAALRLKLKDHRRLADTHAADDVLKNLSALFFKIYEMHRQSKYLKKTEIHKWIPLKHEISREKYFAEAIRQGYVQLRRGQDKRTKDVIPSARLLRFVENELTEYVAMYETSAKEVDREMDHETSTAGLVGAFG